MPYWMIEEGTLRRMASPSPAMRLIAQVPSADLARNLSTLHRSLQAWALMRLSPGLIVPSRVLVDDTGGVAFRAAADVEPQPLLVNVGASPDIAAWLVLLDKSVKTSDLLHSAQAVWSQGELAGALPFAMPAFLPAELLGQPPDNWLRVARALAAVAANPGGM